MDLKKEDEDYIYEAVNKANKSTVNSKDGGKYKEIDKTILQWCPIVLILLITIGILFSTLSAIGGNQTLILAILFYTYITLCTFTISYLVLSLLFWIIGLLSKTFKEDYKSKFYLKISISVIAIIIILIIINSTSCIGCNSMNTIPIKNTKTLLKTQIDNPGAEQCTTSVTFTRSVSKLSSEGITQDSGLNPEQVYFDNPQQISSFDISNPQTLKYTFTTSKKVVMCILCSNSIENLNYAISENARATDEFGSVPNITDNQTICVVYPRKTA
ncbi:MAG: hypothetical protein WCX82_00040 [archaeon]